MALNYKVIGDRLKTIRNNKELTQEKIAEKLDVSIAYISRVEKGSAELSLKRLSQLCALLDIEEGYILNGTSSTSENYLIDDFNSLLKNCPSEKLQLIYDISKVIVNN